MQERRALQLGHDMRFEAAGSNDDEGQSIDINTAFNGDGLNFTEGLLATPHQARPKHFDRHASYSSGEVNSDISNSSGGTKQLAYRDKEEHLVQVAMARIRRAQALGERNVRLTKPELDALERKQRKNQTISRSTGLSGRPASSPPYTSQRTLAVVEPKPSKRRVMPNNSGYDYGGLSIHGNSTSQVTAASPRRENQSDSTSGYFGGPQARSHEISTPSEARSVGSHSPQRQDPSVQASRSRDHRKRYFSVPEGFGLSPAAEFPALSRRLPDDPNWIPRARSASSNQPHVNRDITYATYMPAPLHVASHRPRSRRSVFDNYEAQSSTWERGNQHSVATTTPPQQSFSEFEGTDEPISIPSNATYSGDDSYDDYSEELDYVPYYEPNIPRAPFEGHSRR